MKCLEMSHDNTVFNFTETEHVINCYDGFGVSTRPSFFESEVPCFWIGPSLLGLRPSVSPSHFSSHTFPYFPVSPSHFCKSALLIFLTQVLPYLRVSPSLFSTSFFLIFRVRLSQFFGQSAFFFQSDLLNFSGSPSHFPKSVLVIFRVRPPSHFLHCVLSTFSCSAFRFDRHVHC